MPELEVRLSTKHDSANVLPPAGLLEAADRAVDRLKIRAFVSQRKKTLFKKLLEADASALEAPVDADMMFIVLSLPVASSVIHLGSDRDALAGARQWVTDIWQKADPVPILSTLTLVHIVRLGYEANKKLSKPDEAWERIAHRVKKLTEEMAAEELRRRARSASRHSSQEPGG